MFLGRWLSASSPFFWCHRPWCATLVSRGGVVWKAVGGAATAPTRLEGPLQLVSSSSSARRSRFARHQPPPASTCVNRHLRLSPSPLPAPRLSRPSRSDGGRADRTAPKIHLMKTTHAATSSTRRTARESSVRDRSVPRAPAGRAAGLDDIMVGRAGRRATRAGAAARARAPRLAASMRPASATTRTRGRRSGGTRWR